MNADTKELSRGASGEGRESRKPIFHGTKVVFGVCGHKPVRGLEGIEYHIVMKPDCIAKALITENGQVKHIVLVDCGDHWLADRSLVIVRPAMK